MLVHQMAAPNSPQWFNTGLNYAYGITGPAQGHYYVDPETGEVAEARTPTPTRSRTRASRMTPWSRRPAGPMPNRRASSPSNRVGLECLRRHQPMAPGTTRVVAVKANGEKPVLPDRAQERLAASRRRRDHLVYALASVDGTGRVASRAMSSEPGHALCSPHGLR